MKKIDLHVTGTVLNVAIMPVFTLFACRMVYVTGLQSAAHGRICKFYTIRVTFIP